MDAGRQPYFYGWTIVGSAFVVLFLGFGVAYSFAAFFHVLRDEFDATRGDVSLVFAITGFLYFTVGAVSGPLADRLGPRRVVASGVVLTAVGLLLASRAQALWQIYLTFSLGVGLGVGFAYVPAVGTVQRWFVRRRGFASGLAVTGIGVGTLAIPPLAAGLIDWWGWRETYFAMAVATLVFGLPAALLFEHSPQRKGQQPDGARASASAAVTASASAAAASLSLREAVRSRPFILLYSACLATSLGLFIPFAHLSPYAEDHGLSTGYGAVLVGLIGAGSATGRLVLGGSADRLGRRRALGGTFAGMGLTLLFWLIATETWSLAIFAVLFGISYGGFVALVPALATDYFGGRNAGGILGALYTGAGVGALIGPTLAGAIYDARESYTLPILFGVVMNVVAVACIVVLADPLRWRAQRFPTTPSASGSPAS
ncbi:MAG: MCT family MFS transporter [Tepidiformaceae bacterium]